MGHLPHLWNWAVQESFTSFLAIFIGNGNGQGLILGQMWFLPCLLVAQIIFIRLYNRLSKIGADVFICAIIFCSLLGLLIGKIHALPLGVDIALASQIFLLAGVLIRKYNFVERLTRRHCLILLNVFALVLLFNGKISMFIRDYGELFLFYLGGISGTLLVMKFSIWISNVGGKFCALMKYCGRQSLFVVTAHLIIVFVAYDLIANFTGLLVKVIRPLPEVIFSITLLGLLIPLFIAKKFGKLPVLKYFCV